MTQAQKIAAKFGNNYSMIAADGQKIWDVVLDAPKVKGYNGMATVTFEDNSQLAVAKNCWWVIGV